MQRNNIPESHELEPGALEVPGWGLCSISAAQTTEHATPFPLLSAFLGPLDEARGPTAWCKDFSGGSVHHVCRTKPVQRRQMRTGTVRQYIVIHTPYGSRSS
mmetsp:Transcript_60755/g.162444  ORF Transcript_60755/g.162444 Transcript_60755/m.162444 type:complete len:102 (-) Transcript_60755:1193-1498(-)